MKITISGEVSAKTYNEAYEAMVMHLNNKGYRIIDNVKLHSSIRFTNGSGEIFYMSWEYEADVVHR